MLSPYTVIKKRAALRAFVGIALVLFGVSSNSQFPGFVLVLVGTLICAGSFTRIIRIFAYEQRWLEESSQLFKEFSRATLPRQIFWLLLAVAEVDGRAEEDQHELVRRFLLERFVDPISAADLHTWQVHRVPHEQVGVLAMQLRRILSGSECETLFFWCCLVAFADRVFKPEEHEILHRIARGLGLEQQHARATFHQAKASFLGQEEPRGWQQSTGRAARPAPV